MKTITVDKIAELRRIYETVTIPYDPNVCKVWDALPDLLALAERPASEEVEAMAKRHDRMAEQSPSYTRQFYTDTAALLRRLAPRQGEPDTVRKLPAIQETTDA